MFENVEDDFELTCTSKGNGKRKSNNRTDEFYEGEVKYENHEEPEKFRLKKSFLSLEDSVNSSFESFVDSSRAQYDGVKRRDLSTVSVTSYPSALDRVIRYVSKSLFIGVSLSNVLLIRYGLGIIYYKEMKSYGISKKAALLEEMDKYVSRPITKGNKLPIIKDDMPGLCKKALYIDDDTLELFMDVKTTLNIGSTDLALLCLILALENSITVKKDLPGFRSTYELLREKKGLKVFKSKSEYLRMELRNYQSHILLLYYKGLSERKSGKNTNEQQLSELYHILCEIKDLRMVGLLDFEIEKPF